LKKSQFQKSCLDPEIQSSAQLGSGSQLIGGPLVGQLEPESFRLKSPSVE